MRSGPSRKTVGMGGHCNSRTSRPLQLNLSGEEAADGLDDVDLLLFGQLGVHREGEGLAGGALGLGEVAGPVAEVAEALLEVERDGVVNLGADAVGAEVRDERVAVRGVIAPSRSAGSRL